MLDRSRLWLLLGDAEIDRIQADALAGASPWWAVAWLVFRFLGAAVTVPIVEELAFRGCLLRLLTRGPGADPHPYHGTVVGPVPSLLAFKPESPVGLTGSGEQDHAIFRTR